MAKKTVRTEVRKGDKVLTKGGNVGKVSGISRHPVTRKTQAVFVESGSDTFATPAGGARILAD